MAQGKQAMHEPPLSAFASQTSTSFMTTNYTQPMYQPYPGAYQEPAFHQQMTMATEQHLQISDADFEEAFSDAFTQAQEMDRIQDAHQILHKDGTYTNDHSPDVEAEKERDHIRIGSDAIQYTEWKDRSVDQDAQDADELARTAGQLLNSVQHETSTKFQNSQFLDLMRKIRDREVEVQNNDLQNTITGQPATALSKDDLLDGAKQQQPQREEPESALQSHDPNTFQFPDMNKVYEPQPPGATQDEEVDVNAHNRSAGSWDYPPASSPEWRSSLASSDVARDIYVQAQMRRQMDLGYNVDEDGYPQTHALHPGGRLYPDQSPPLNRVEMSGAVGVSATDFDTLDENATLATRYGQGKSGDGSQGASA